MSFCNGSVCVFCMLFSGEYLSKHEKCKLCDVTCYKCTGPESEDCISCSSTRWGVSWSLVSHSKPNVQCVCGEKISLLCSLAGCLIMGSVCSAVILGSTRGMDSVISATTHAWSVQTTGLINALAVPKVNSWVVTASLLAEKTTDSLHCFCFHTDKFGVERYLFKQECRESCPGGYFHSPKGTCEPCPPNCTVCTSTGHCLHCTPSYYPKDGTCARLLCGVGQLHHNFSRMFPMACLTFSIVSFFCDY